MHYSVFYVVSFMGTKLFGLEGTILTFQKFGRLLRKCYPFKDSAEALAKRLERGMHFVPFNVKCLDQAIVAWFALGLHGHSSTLRIGLSIKPLESHAWVVCGNRTFVEAPNIPDLKVVAEYGEWGR